MLEVLDNVSKKNLGTKQYIDRNMKVVLEREKLTVEAVFYFVAFCLDGGCLCVMFACLKGSGWVNGLLFHLLFCFME